ncbi:exosortase/archaeosortase family protein [bacterium]|nr:exosortase/archaeosortase family protein [bacterium]
MRIQTDRGKIFLILLVSLIIQVLFHGYFLWILSIYHHQPMYFYILLTPLISYLLFRHAQTSLPFKLEKNASGIFCFFVFLLLGFLIFLYGFFFGMYFFEGAALVVFAFSLCCLFYGMKKAKKVLFPCFFLIFLYPFEWRLSFLSHWINRLNTIIVGTFFDQLGMPVKLSLENYSVTVSDFTLILVERCSGLDTLIILLMFLSILPWICKFNLAQTLIWIASIPLFILISNILRILLFTIAGVTGMNCAKNDGFDKLLGTFFLVFLALLFMYEKNCLKKCYNSR